MTKKAVEKTNRQWRRQTGSGEDKQEGSGEDKQEDSR